MHIFLIYESKKCLRSIMRINVPCIVKNGIIFINIALLANCSRTSDHNDRYPQSIVFGILLGQAKPHCKIVC
jgi:hypothetical protein